MATASHAAEFQLRQTAWAMQALATGLKGFEPYRLVTTTIGKQQALGFNHAAFEIGILVEGFLETQP